MRLDFMKCTVKRTVYHILFTKIITLTCITIQIHISETTGANTVALKEYGVASEDTYYLDYLLLLWERKMLEEKQERVQC